MARRVLFAVAGAAIALLAAPGVASAADTRAAYVAEAEPYCASANRDIFVLNQKFAKQDIVGKRRAAARTLRKTGTRLRRSVAQVRSIAPPPGDEALIDRWLDLVDHVADNNVAKARAYLHRKGEAYYAIGRNTLRTQDRARALVVDFGFDECSGG